MAITFYVDDRAGFNAAVASLTSLGTETFEQSSQAAGTISAGFPDPLAPGVNNGPFATGTSTSIGITVQANANNDNPATVALGGATSLVTAAAGYVGTPDDQISTNISANSFDMLFDPPGTPAARAVGFVPLYFDSGPSTFTTDTLTIRVYDTSNNLIGTTTIVGGNYVTEASFVGIVTSGADDIGRININDSAASSNDYVGADDIQVLIDSPAPVLSGITGDNAAFTEGSSVVADVGANAVLTDATSVTSATIEITDDIAGDVLTATTQGGVVASYLNGVLTLSGSATAATYQAILRTVRFNNTGDNPTALGTDTSRSLTWIVTNAGALTASQSSTVTVTGVNDAAILGSANVSLAATESRLATHGALSISDVDSAATFVAQTNVAGTNGVFSIRTNGAWAYEANSAFASLATGSSVNDTFNVASADGTTTTVQVTINGSANAAPGGGSGESLGGTGGRDVMSGLGGADTLSGGGGNDTLDGGAAGDTLDGGTGVNTASYASAGAGVQAVLFDAQYNTGDAAGDVYISIQNLAGSASDDKLFGDALANSLDGGGGNDVLFGMDGDDILTGGGVTGSGYNQLWGGNGSDTANYAAETTSVTADLRNFYAYVGGVAPANLRDTFNSIENLIGGSANDVLVGDGAANTIDGRAGADQLYGFGGADVFAYHDWIDSNVVSGYDTIADFVAGVDKIDLRSFATDAAHVQILSASGSTKFYVEQTPGVFNQATDLAVSLIGLNALTTADFLF